MKTENKQRELAFLRYLDALEASDVVAIAIFLEEAEQDEILEQMMLDYHDEQEQQTEEKPKLIIPFKLKREQTRRMIQIIGTSAVAALVLITVGMMGIFVGMRQQGETAIADVQNCNVTLTNEDNTVNLIGGEDIESPIHVGVNNPFTLYLNTGEASEGYQVIFEGLRAIMSYDDLIVEGDCSQERIMTIYPSNTSGQICEVGMETVRFPFGDSNRDVSIPFSIDGSNIDVKLISDTLVVLDRPIEDTYPVLDVHFEGSIHASLVNTTDGCLNYPLLYVPSRFDDRVMYDWNLINSFKLEIDKIRVREQRFENGIMLHIEAIDEVWVSYYDLDGMERTRTYDAEWIEANPISNWLDAPEGLLEPERGLFGYIWQFTGRLAENHVDRLTLGDEIGWAISEPITYMASYEYPTEGGNIEDWYHHFIEISTGEIYEFYPSSSYLPNTDTPEWNTSNTQNCSVTLANEDNTVNLIGGEDIESAIHVGVNNPFTVYLNTNPDGEYYYVVFEGLRAIIASDDLIVEGDCSQEAVVTIYPSGELGQSCEIGLEPVKYPFSAWFISHPTVSTPIVLDRQVEDIYPVVTDSFVGGIPVRAVHLIGECSNYPLLYVPPRSDDNRLSINVEEQVYEYTLQVDSIRVREQRFENGIMLYIEVLDAIWAAYYDIEGIQRWSSLDVAYAGDAINGYESMPDVPEGLYAPEMGIFHYMWKNMYMRADLYEYPNSVLSLGENLGWAISEPITYMAAYEYPTGRENVMNWHTHFIEISTGEVYQFYRNSQTYPPTDSPEWHIVGDDE